MAAYLASYSIISSTPTRDLNPHRLSRCSSKLFGQSYLNCSPVDFSLQTIHPSKSKVATSKRQVIIRAGLRDGDGKTSSASIFVGGFVLGGIIVGTLGCVYAPKINKALSGADKKDLMRKLPKFIYDEDKALEKTRKVLEQKIAQLNSAIDGVSSELRADNAPNGAVATSDEMEATI